MRNPKFNFTPERQLGKEKKETTFRVSVYKSGQMVFGSDVVHIYDLDGKFIKIYGDPEKKVIGWSVFEKQSGVEGLDELRQLKLSVNGNIVVSVSKLLKNMGVELDESIKNLEVKRYESSLYPDPIFYIEIPNKEVTL